VSRRAMSDNLDRELMAPEDGPSLGRFESRAELSPQADEALMRRALRLAAQTHPHPNPRVGAVIVAAGEVIGEAAHVRAGEPHAEVLALRQAGEAAKGSTVYVTLEPCSHHGRTPPCADALIKAGVSTVVVAVKDPDQRVSGQGIARLQAAGIAVTTGLLSEDVEATDPGYFHHRRTGLPLVTLKLATTLDGQIAAADRTSKWITGEEARRDGHRLRSEADIVLVGAGTVLDDDPRLDIRLDGYTGPHPRPVVIAGKRSLPGEAQVFARDALVYTPRPLNVSVEQVIVGDGPEVDLGSVMKDLGSRGYVAALVEGGARLAAELLRGGHVDRIVFYLAAKLGVGRGLGAFAGEFTTISEALRVEIVDVRRIGQDVRIEAEVRI
jgi:diaminohydroxyphosphoribosylaminopyrimidine deaminase/5-amino-6-(5-phosphoribosylamino)uracil reductase